MRTILSTLVLLPALLHAAPEANFGRDTDSKKKSDELGKEVKITPFRKLFQYDGASQWQTDFGEDHPYSGALGFTLWKTKGSELAEVTAVPLLTSDQYKKDIEAQLKLYIGDEKYKALSQDEKDVEFKKISDKTKFLVYGSEDKGFHAFNVEEYDKQKLAARLGIFDSQGNETDEASAVLFSIRSAFTYFNANQEGMAIDYTNTDGNGSLKLKGALMTDIYWGPLYNGRWFKDPTFIENTYRFSLRTGIEFDQDDAATKPTDRTSFYLLANFQANPDQNAHILGVNNWWQITSPQFLQIGAALDHDDFTGDDDVRWIVGWQPRLYVVNDLRYLEGLFGPTGRGFGINHLMRYKKESFLQLSKPDPSEAKKETKPADQSAWYSYIPADIKLSGGSDTWEKLAKGDEDLDKANVEWKLGLVFGNSDYRWRFGYTAEGVSPISNLGDTHIGHSLFAEGGLGNISNLYATTQRNPENKKGPFVTTELSDGDLGAMTIFAKYTFGEFAPTFEDQEIFQIGTRIRF